MKLKTRNEVIQSVKDGEKTERFSLYAYKDGILYSWIKKIQKEFKIIN